MMTITMTMTTTTFTMMYDNDNNYEDWRRWRWWLQPLALVIGYSSWSNFSKMKIMTDEIMANMMTTMMKTTMMTPTGCVGHQLPKLVQVLDTPGPTAAQSETICEYQPNHGAPCSKIQQAVFCFLVLFCFETNQRKGCYKIPHLTLYILIIW